MLFRSVSRGFPEPPLSSSVGPAGRRRDGPGCRIFSVDSRNSSKFSLSLPSGGLALCLSLASCRRGGGRGCLRAASSGGRLLLPFVVHGGWRRRRWDPVSPFSISSLGSPDLEMWFLPLQLCSCRRGGGRWAAEAASISSRVATAVFFLDLISRCVPGGASARLGRLPVSVATLLFLVEGRPIEAVMALFFPPDAPSSDGRQPSASQAHAVVSSDLVKMAQRSRRPKWFVPGDGGFGVRLVLLQRTGLRFCSLFWGPLCKMQGLVCNFLFFRGPCVRCACTVCSYI